MRQLLLHKLIIFLVTLLCVQQTKAQFEEGIEMPAVFGLPALTGSALNGSNPNNTTTYTSQGEMNAKILNIITLKIKEGTSLYFKTNFSATANLSIELTDANNNTTTETLALTVQYDKTEGAKYTIRDYKTYKDYHKIKVTITSLPVTGATGWDPREILEVENEMRIIRYYTLSTAAADLSPVITASQPTADVLNVSWSFPSTAGNNMSQLEWAYVEDEMAAYYNNNYELIFGNNSTRVDLEYQSLYNFKIPLLFPGPGKLYYRTRAAQRKGNGTLITGPWSIVSETQNAYVFSGHEDAMNWQSSTTFAEGGKYKSVIQYFDGSFRSRQTVTKDNSTGNTMVGETLYDMQGRPNVQILPTPTIDNTIKYFQHFNRFTGMQATDDPAKYFDLTPAAVKCHPAPTLDNSFGNGKYYSGQNEWLSSESKSGAIPHSQGYGFTETRFTDDATQRVKVQGGVGPDHQIGSNHETKYFYGKPSQPELDALFGTEAGDASHYSKNMVQDANGQMSVSYVDMHGRTIATALAGKSPAALDSINADYPQSGELKNDLLTTATNIIQDGSIVSVSTILVPSTTDYNFTYKLTPEILQIINCSNQPICFDCKYDLEISIKGEDCGNELPVIKRYNNLQPVAANQTCGTAMGFTGEGITSPATEINFSMSLAPGSYVVRKTLTINEEQLALRKAIALQELLCKTEQQLYDSVLTVLQSTSGCGNTVQQTCDECQLKLGTYVQYKAKYQEGSPSATEAEIQAQYDTDNEACAVTCGGLNPKLATVKRMREQMLADMTPYTGQYAEAIPGGISANDPYFKKLTAKYNIFSDHYYIDATTSISKPYFYENPKHENGQTNYIDEAGNVVMPDYSMVNIFTGDFEKSWANSLIVYHPEYTKLRYAETIMKTSYDWLDNFQNCSTYQAAVTNGYMVPVKTSTGTVNDPYFLLANTAADKTSIENKLYNGVGPNHPSPSIWQIANGSVLCDGITNQDERMTCIKGTTINGLDPRITSAADKDKVWERFKTIYLGYRNDVVVQHINTYAEDKTIAGFTATTLTQPEMDKMTSPTEGRQLVFGSVQDIANQNGWTWWAGVTNPTETNTSDIPMFLANNSIDNCEGQKPIWRARLMQCEQIKNLIENNNGELVNTIMNAILKDLVRICNHSVTPTQPYGATNVDPAYAGQPRTFEDVINTVFAANGIQTSPGNNYFCNPFSIDFPKPFGLNPAVTVNYSNTADSCACNRFAVLKAEAAAASYNSQSFAEMNLFLQQKYNDTLTLVLWNGMQQCNSIIVNTCDEANLTTTNMMVVNPETTGCAPCVLDVSTRINNQPLQYIAKCEINFLPGFESGTNDSFEAFINPLAPLCDTACPAAGITSVVPDTVNNNLLITYQLPAGCDSSKIFMYSGSTLIFSNNLSCSSTQIAVPARARPHYDFDLEMVSDANFGVFPYVGDKVTLYINRPAPMERLEIISYDREASIDNFSKLAIKLNNLINTAGVNGFNSVLLPGNILRIIAPATYGNTLATTAVGLEYTAVPPNQYPPGGSSNGITVGFVGTCDPGPYRFVIITYTATCGEGVSDTAFYNGCNPETDTCIVYKPIQLTDFVPIPQFLNCGYIKPCITCTKLVELTTDFRNLYPAYIGVPYTTSTTTDEQAQQNALWARFLNYRTGFSKNAMEYMAAYVNCNTNPATQLCALEKPLNDVTDIYPTPTDACMDVKTQAQSIAYTLLEKRKETVIADFERLYKAKCFNAKYLEQFYVRYTPKEYHYTLYYYDQAGNLVKTIPPAAVKPNYDPTYLANVVTARNTGSNLIPGNNEIMATEYRYNALNQVVVQQTPDAGTSKFWYDRLGRLAVSQNAKQATENKYSYTVYDALGRITEVGQKPQTTAMTQAISQNDADLQTWVTGGSLKEQITRTAYDVAYYSGEQPATLEPILFQKNLRNRVSYTQLINQQPANNIYAGVQSAATYYSYDIHGNVDTLVQDLKDAMASSNNRYKKMVYDYDLISGKVNRVSYQPGQTDQFYHQYSYDAENRLVKVNVSSDSIYWEKDAAYDYYRHGPLSRTVLGQNKVQGLDYAYTIQGWLKGINSTSVTPLTSLSYDLGRDGLPGTVVARDAFAFELNYFNGDYYPLSGNSFANITDTPPSLADGVQTGRDLYNGNIRAMLVNIPQLVNPMLYSYRYDQLNRLKAMNYYTGFNDVNNSFNNPGGNVPLATEAYKERISYDPNGNIKAYLRNGSSSQTGMDDLSYGYDTDINGNLQNNKLRHVKDAIGSTNYAHDLDNQQDDNYTYDATGNLTADLKEGITNISWNVYGKIASITKASGTLNYTYDASGNRISKTSEGKITRYVRDASGNVMSIYVTDPAINGGALTQTELPMYGSSRLGVWNMNRSVSGISTIDYAGYRNTFVRGNKFFELSNHLGNVLATVSDKQIGVDNETTNGSSSPDGLVDYFMPDVITANDYYPFGMQMPGRKYAQANTNYRYGFNSHEKSDEISGEGNHTTAQFGEYDTRLGRRWNPDPRPNVSTSVYSVFSNCPIFFNDIDLDTARNAGNGVLGQRFEFTNDGSLSAAQFQKMQYSFLDNLNQQVNNSGRTYNGYAISLNTNDPLASVIHVTFGATGTSNANMAQNQMFITQSDINQKPNVSTHEWLHTAGLMDRYYELYGRAKTNMENNYVVDNQRSGTVPMGILPPGHDDSHSASNIMASSGSQITAMQWGIVFNLGSTGRTEESLGTLGKVSMVFDFTFANHPTYLHLNKQRSLTQMTKGLTANTNKIAFSSRTAYYSNKGPLLSVPNKNQTGLYPDFINSYIIHNRTGNVLGAGFKGESNTDKNQLNSTINR